jgi:hypothetical protein
MMAMALSLPDFIELITGVMGVKDKSTLPVMTSVMS